MCNKYNQNEVLVSDTVLILQRLNKVYPTAPIRSTTIILGLRRDALYNPVVADNSVLVFNHARSTRRIFIYSANLNGIGEGFRQAEVGKNACTLDVALLQNTALPVFKSDRLPVPVTTRMRHSLHVM